MNTHINKLPLALVLMLGASVCVIGCNNTGTDQAKVDSKKQKEDNEILYKGKPASVWIKQLKDRDASSRIEAVKALREIGTEQEGVVKGLLATMNDKEKSVQEEARGAFGSFPLETKVSALLKGVKSDDNNLRSDARRILNELGLPNAESITPAAIQEAIEGKEAIEAFSRLGAKHYSWTDPITKQTMHTFTMLEKTTDDDLRKIPWVPFPFRLDLWHAKVTDAGLWGLSNLKNLTHLDLLCTNVRDTGLKGITNLKNLTYLNLAGTYVTDAGLKEIANFKNLTYLGLDNSLVSDSGLKEIAKLKTLTGLSLGNIAITDAGLKEIANLKNLTSLNLRQTSVTDAGVTELRKVLPKVDIQR